VLGSHLVRGCIAFLMLIFALRHQLLLSLLWLLILILSWCSLSLPLAISASLSLLLLPHSFLVLMAHTFTTHHRIKVKLLKDQEQQFVRKKRDRRPHRNRSNHRHREDEVPDDLGRLLMSLDAPSMIFFTIIQRGVRIRWGLDGALIEMHV